jgi:hypothetical protein
MTRKNNPEDTIQVKTVPPSGKGARVGKPDKIVTSAMRMRTASGLATTGTVTGMGGNFYSPGMATDFLEMPQSRDEQRNYYRQFYDYDPYVGQAIDQLTEIPISKVRLGIPEARNRELAEKAYRFCERWAKKIHLEELLLGVAHEYIKLGEAHVFCEDVNPDMPPEIRGLAVREIKSDGSLVERWEEYEDADAREVEWLKKNYKGWTAVRVLPPDQIKVESFTFTDQTLIELVPDAKSKAIVDRARQGDPQAQRIANSMPADIVEAILEGRNPTLNTDPDAGSFVFTLARKRSPYEPHGKSILQRCMQTLVFRDKVRQSLTSIASRHMTPYRLIYAEDMSEADTEALREQVDLALQDPDFSVITNFQVNWEERGADQRLPDWSWVWENTNQQLYAGLGVTEGLLSGESSYSGDRIHLEVLNTRFMLFREMFQRMVEDYFFAPMCRRMGFIEEDEDGELRVLVPSLSFTRLALRDTADTYDALFNLYQKNSVPIDVILDLFNLDPVEIERKLKRDMFTVNDALFNELLRGVYSKAGDMLVDGTNIVERIAQNIDMTYEKPKDDAGRF